MNQTNELQGVGQSNISSKSYILKKWDECSADEKLDKLRDELRSTRYMNNRIYTVESALHELSTHTHDANGNPVTKMDLFKSQRLGGVPSSSIDNLA